MLLGIFIEITPKIVVVTAHQWESSRTDVSGGPRGVRGETGNLWRRVDARGELARGGRRDQCVGS
jgi:hypothetical protein